MARATSGSAEQRWRERVRRWRNSGQTVREFCWREGVSEPSFYQWRKRLRPGRALAHGSKPAVFVPVRVVDLPSGGRFTETSAAPAEAARRPDGDAAGVIEIGLPGGVTIRAGSQVDEPRLRSALRAVVAETQ